jgi:hypothetical protein
VPTTKKLCQSGFVHVRCLELFLSPSSSNRVQVPCLTWLLLVGTACLSMLGCSACQPVLSWPRIRSLYALCMLLVVSLTLCVAGLLLLLRRWRFKLHWRDMVWVPELAWCWLGLSRVSM